MLSILILLIISLINLTILVYLVFSLHKKSLIKPINKTEELADFLADMHEHGYSVVRVDPDRVFYKGNRH